MLFDYKTKLRIALAGCFFICMGAVAKDIHDPTLPKLSITVSGQTVKSIDAKKEQQVKLQSIVNKKNKRMAIIDGELYQVGASVNGYKISQIRNNYLILTKSGEQKRLYVYE